MNDFKIRTLGWKDKKKRRIELRYNPTETETLVWERIKSKKFHGLKFRSQHGIGPFIVDFYYAKTMTIIEIDGNIHDDEVVIEYDKSREQYFTDRGYNIMRFRNIEVLQDLDKVLEKIQQHIFNLNSSIS